MDAIEFLKREHEKAKAKFADVLGARPEARQALWEELAPELETHEEIEDAALYEPLERDARGADAILGEWRERHQSEVERAETLIDEIEDLDAEEEEWREKVEELHQTLRTHIQEEEEAIFPRIGRVWDSARLERAGTELEAMKSRKAAAS
jgi:iron-sulfur cluster repair protein YtfE (RIC family)